MSQSVATRTGINYFVHIVAAVGAVAAAANLSFLLEENLQKRYAISLPRGADVSPNVAVSAEFTVT